MENSPQSSRQLKLLEAVLVHCKEAVCSVDASWRFTFVSEQFLRTFGMTRADQAIGKTPFDLYPDFGKSIFFHAMKGVMDSRRPFSRVGFSENTKRWYMCRGFPCNDGAVMMATDISDDQDNREKLVTMSMRDPLTSLPTWMALELDVNKLISKGAEFCLAKLGLDRFKALTDAFGPGAGDKMLMELASRFSMSTTEAVRCYRVGGDEFIVVGEVAVERFAATAQEFLDKVKLPFRLKDLEVSLSARAGIVVAPIDGEDLDTLLRRASLALTKSKSEQSAEPCHYEPEMESSIRERMSIESALRNAISLNQLEMHYQPKSDVATGNVAGVEALIRWTLPGRGRIAPDVFLPVAVSCGLMADLDAWVLDASIAHAAELVARGLDVPVAINLSASALCSSSTVDLVRSLMEKYLVRPESLEIEINEAAMMTCVETSKRVLDALSAMKIKVSIDDFGTGYSSLAYLVKFPVQTLKIDRQFVTHMKGDASNRTIVSGLISLAHSLSMSVVAEGVETAEELQLLREMKCDVIQGYYFAKPMPFDDVVAFIQGKARGAKPKINPYA